MRIDGYKLFLFVDVRGWAFDNIAQRISAGLSAHLDVEIVYTEDFKSYKACSQFIEKRAGDKVCFHFFWRGYLLELLRYTASGKRRALSALKKSTVTTHVPDHLNSSFSDLAGQEGAVFSFVDGYFVTSQKLLSAYEQALATNPPWGVIHDNPVIHVDYRENSDRDGPLKVVWVGNSEWGEHLGEYDYKGFKTVLEPAFDAVREQVKVDFRVFDKAVSLTPKETIDNEFADADIVLVASREEGTPLPLIEAMAAGCAVVTTDVGIAGEVLPECQRDFICHRNASAFAQAILTLDSDRERLRRIKEENRKAYDAFFGDVTTSSSLWLDFLDAASSRRRDEEKDKAISALKLSPVRSALFGLFFWLSSRLSAVDFVKNLVKRNSLLSGFYHRFYAWMSASNDASDGKTYEMLLSGKDFITVYSPFYLGVRNSTESYFGDNAIPFPFSPDISPETASHPDLEAIVTAIKDSGIRSVVYSGGPALHQVMCEMLAKQAPWIRQYFAWHGSPAQWSDWHQLDHFNRWLELHRRGVLQGIVSFKRGLESSLARMGVDAWHVMNFISDGEINEKRQITSRVKVGLFAAAFSWFKNPYPQIVSLFGMDDVELHSNLGKESLPAWVGEHANIVEVPKKMPHQAFKDYLKGLDLVLYVTNTECSPLIALESLSVGVPCIVGPAGNIYKGNAFLESLLVEPEVDNPEAIRERVLSVIEHFDEVQEAIPGFIEEYNLEATGKQDQLYSVLEAG